MQVEPSHNNLLEVIQLERGRVRKHNSSYARVDLDDYNTNAGGPEVYSSSTFQSSGWTFHDAAFFPATNELVVVAAGTAGAAGDNSGFHSVLSFNALNLSLNTVDVFAYRAADLVARWGRRCSRCRA
jgi:hypothetical protein